MPKHKRLWLLLVFLSAVFLTGCSFDMFSAGQFGIRISEDSGKTWAPANQLGDSGDLGRQSVNDIAVNPLDADNIIIGTEAGGVYYTVDGGKVWQSTPLTLLEVSVKSVVFDPVNPKTMYAAGAAGATGRLFKSVDGGTSWNEMFLETVGQQALTAVAVDPRDHRRVFIATGNGAIMLSDDYGNTWRQMTDVEDNYDLEFRKKGAGYDFNASNCGRKDIYTSDKVREIVMDPYSPGVVFLVLATGGIQKSTDGGQSFRDLSPKMSKYPCALFARVLVIDPSNSNVVYQGSEYGLLYSNDLGESWAPVPTIIQSDSLPVRAIAVNPQNGQEIFITASNAVYKSIDHGQNWSVVELDAGYTNTILINQFQPSQVMIGVHQGPTSSVLFPAPPETDF